MAPDLEQSTAYCARCRHRLAEPGLRFCSQACRALAAKARQPRAHLASVASAATVYYCPSCHTKTLGDDHCPACDRYRRSLGLGGLCPCCDQPVALQELLGGEMTLLLTF